MAKNIKEDHGGIKRIILKYPFFIYYPIAAFFGIASMIDERIFRLIAIYTLACIFFDLPWHNENKKKVKQKPIYYKSSMEDPCYNCENIFHRLHVITPKGIVRPKGGIMPLKAPSDRVESFTR
jgi:hypothetical protein